MKCKVLGECGSCTLYDLNYEEQLLYKKNYVLDLFKNDYLGDIEIFDSPRSHYRSRAEFRIWHEKDDFNYAMHSLEDNNVLEIQSCSKVNSSIFSLMPKIKEEILKFEVLKRKLFAIEFLSSKTEILVTLIYHKPLDDIWKDQAWQMGKKLNIKIIGRCRGKKIIITDDKIQETLKIFNTKYFFYLTEGAFSQPNTIVNEKMISWVKEKLEKDECKDFLELYCGHGNFTIPLSEHFRYILATEISKASIKNAKENTNLNNVKNIEFLRMSAKELSQALKEQREFRRLADVNLNKYNFSHILVDPPRAGIDEESLNFIKEYPKIIYISCNPITLKRDLEILCKSHKIESLAVFDQFPYTKHIETIVYLKA